MNREAGHLRDRDREERRARAVRMRELRAEGFTDQEARDILSGDLTAEEIEGWKFETEV